MPISMPMRTRLFPALALCLAALAPAAALANPTDAAAFAGRSMQGYKFDFGADAATAAGPATLTDASHGLSGSMRPMFMFKEDGKIDVPASLIAATPPAALPFSPGSGILVKQVAVPEPASLALLAGVLALGIGFTVRRARTTQR